MVVILIERTTDFAKHIFGEYNEMAKDWSEKGARGEKVRWMMQKNID